MKQRIITAIAIILVVLFPVAMGGWALEALALFIVISGCYEWIHLQDNFKHWGWFILPFTILAVLLSRYVDTRNLYVLCGVCFFIYWALPVFDEQFSQNNSFSCIACFFLFLLCYLAIGMIIEHHQYLWTICFATYGSDTFAYFTGRFFGKHKMNERISPKKTWEGFIGGIAGGFLLSWAVSLLYVSQLDFGLNLALCLICPIVAELGDLCFSSYKRACNAKDFSNLLPGHGGVLDRVDSLLANILLFGILYQIFF
jgi:phosphatidate cytidylyltransferase